MLDWVVAQRAVVAKRPLVVGISGPQGCGKSTRAAALVTELERRGMRAVAVSIDDFYRTRAEQVALAAAHPGDPYLEHRGYPGTHDVALGAATLAALCNATSAVIAVPVYDKGACSGRGDRAPVAVWRQVTGPFDVVILEGWMVGFRPVPESELPDRWLVSANAALAAYTTWHERLDALVHLAAARLEDIVDWRVDAERARRAAGQSALSDAEASDYILRFLPAYRLYTPELPVPTLRLTLGADRRVQGRRE